MTDFVDPIVIAQIGGAKDLLVQEVARATISIDVIEAYAGSLPDPLITEAPVDGQQYARKDAAWSVVTGGAGGEAVWGGITGTLAEQIDLQEALDLKTNDSVLAPVAKSGKYVDLTGKPAIIPEAPLDANQYARSAGAWEVVAAAIPDSPTITGIITRPSGGGNRAEYKPIIDDAKNTIEYTARDLFGDIAHEFKTNDDGAWHKVGAGVYKKLATVDEIPVSGTVWGGITGTLSSQTDLQAALNAKATTTSLAPVATSGSYIDLTNKPSIAAPTLNGTALGSSNIEFSATDFNVEFSPFDGFVITSLGGAAASTTFTGLSDTPSTYTGQGGKVVSVNAGGTALEFTTPSGGGSTTGVMDYTKVPLVEEISEYASGIEYIPTGKLEAGRRTTINGNALGANQITYIFNAPSTYGLVAGDVLEVTITNVPHLKLSGVNTVLFFGSGGSYTENFNSAIAKVTCSGVAPTSASSIVFDLIVVQNATTVDYKIRNAVIRRTATNFC